MLSSATGAAGGAAIGSLAGPGGAALGGATGALGGSIIAESFTQQEVTPIVTPTGEIIMPQPETGWGLLGKLIDAFPMLIFWGVLIWLLSLFAPSPLDWLKRRIKLRNSD